MVQPTLAEDLSGIGQIRKPVGLQELARRAQTQSEFRRRMNQTWLGRRVVHAGDALQVAVEPLAIAIDLAQAAEMMAIDFFGGDVYEPHWVSMTARTAAEAHEQEGAEGVAKLIDHHWEESAKTFATAGSYLFFKAGYAAGMGDTDELEQLAWMAVLAPRVVAPVQNAVAAQLGRGFRATGAGLGRVMKPLEPRIANFVHNRLPNTPLYAPLMALGRWLNLNFCFAAGTPLLTPEGSKPIEELRPGDLVLSRSEFDPDGPVEPKEVQEVFRRFGLVLRLTVGGVAIDTTTEHPFWSVTRGEWVPAGELEVSEELAGHDGRRVRVEAVERTEESRALYNLRVADHHTYFVGCPEWGFSVWVHNHYLDFIGRLRGQGGLAVPFEQLAQSRALRNLANDVWATVRSETNGGPATMTRQDFDAHLLRILRNEGFLGPNQTLPQLLMQRAWEAAQVHPFNGRIVRQGLDLSREGNPYLAERNLFTPPEAEVNHQMHAHFEQLMRSEANQTAYQRIRDLYAAGFEEGGKRSVNRLVDRDFMLVRSPDSATWENAYHASTEPT